MERYVIGIGDVIGFVTGSGLVCVAMISSVDLLVVSKVACIL